MAMRHFRYIEPANPDQGNWEPREVIVSDTEIIEDYWPWWSQKMLALGREPTQEHCIQDFLSGHWATEVPSGEGWSQ